MSLNQSGTASDFASEQGGEVFLLSKRQWLFVEVASSSFIFM